MKFKTYDESIDWFDGLQSERDLHAIWSMGDTDFDSGFEYTGPELGDVAIEGDVIFECSYDGFWGKGRDYRCVMTDPTYMDIWEAASEMIEVTGDYHHVFLEGFSKSGVEDDGTPIYEFYMGS